MKLEPLKLPPPESQIHHKEGLHTLGSQVLRHKCRDSEPTSSFISRCHSSPQPGPNLEGSLPGLTASVEAQLAWPSSLVAVAV